MVLQSVMYKLISVHGILFTSTPLYKLHRRNEWFINACIEPRFYEDLKQTETWFGSAAKFLASSSGFITTSEFLFSCTALISFLYHPVVCMTYNHPLSLLYLAGQWGSNHHPSGIQVYAYA